LQPEENEPAYLPPDEPVSSQGGAGDSPAESPDAAPEKIEQEILPAATSREVEPAILPASPLTSGFCRPAKKTGATQPRMPVNLHRTTIMNFLPARRRCLRRSRAVIHLSEALALS